MKSLSLRQRTLIGFTAIALSLGGTLEIAAAATASSVRDLNALTNTELSSSDITVETHDAEKVAIKFKKRPRRRFRRSRRRRFNRHHGHSLKKHHGRSGLFIKKF